MQTFNSTTDAPAIEPSIRLSASGNIEVTFKHHSGNKHSVEIPQSLNGMRLISQILKARQDNKARLGELGNPTQAIVDAWLSSKKEQEAQEKAEQEAQSTAELLDMF